MFFHKKQSTEEYYLDIDFSGDLGTDTISSAVVTATEGNIDVTATIIDISKQEISGNSVYFWVRAGTNAIQYHITVGVTAVSDAYYEQDLILTIKNN